MINKKAHSHNIINKTNYLLGEEDNALPIANAYWISPSGRIVEVEQTHILKVLEHPHMFGLDPDEIKEKHEKFNEPIGSEGYAREEIMTDLIRNGWIRVRYVPKHDSWTIQLNANSINTIPKYTVGSFLSMLVVQNNRNKYKGLRIINLNSDILFDGDIDDAINGEAPIVESAGILNVVDLKNVDIRVLYP